MKHLIIWLAIFTIGSKFTIAQSNLVPNAQFENTLQLNCQWTTSAESFKEYLENWYIPTNTTADVHSTTLQEYCWSNPITDRVNTNKPGYQAPHSGNTMIGIYTYVSSHYWHEYVQVRLISTMKKDQPYHVEMWVSRADYDKYATNNLGMLFSPEPISEFSGDSFRPQFNSAQVISNTNDWIQLSGTVILNEDCKYLTIGNFYSDELTIIELTANDVIENEEANIGGAYYFIDDVIVSPISF